MKSNLLLVPLLVATLIGVVMAGDVGESGAPPFRIGFSTRLFTEVNDADAKASIKAWAQTVAHERGINMDPSARLFDNTNDIVDAMKRGAVDAMSMTFAEYMALAKEVETSNWFLTRTSGSLSEEYILLVEADSDITDLRELESHAILLHDSARTSLAMDWLDHLVLSAGHGVGADVYFGGIQKVGKVSAAVLPVFFGKADATVVAASNFQMMSELNPQLLRKLKVIAKSPPLVPAIMCFRKDFDSPEKERLMSALAELHMTPAGEQVLTIFQSQALVAVNEEPLHKTAAFVAEVRDLRLNASAAGGGGKGR